LIATRQSHAFVTTNRIYPISLRKPQPVQLYYPGKFVIPLAEEGTQLHFVSELRTVKQFKVTHGLTSDVHNFLQVLEHQTSFKEEDMLCLQRPSTFLSKLREPLKNAIKLKYFGTTVTNTSMSKLENIKV
jgi:hypothetical protein